MRERAPRNGSFDRPFIRLHPFAIFALVLLVACGDEAPVQPDMDDAPPEPLSALVAADRDVLIGFATAPGAGEVALVESVGGQVTHQYRYVPVLAASIPEAAAETLEADLRVLYVEDDLPLYPLGGKQIDDWGVQRIEAPEAWDAGYQGKGAKVGIFDSGIDVDHPDLIVAGGIDLVGDGRGLDDCNGHGTHVAGIVGANRNGNHTVGVAPKAQLYSMRLADCDWGGGTLSKMIQGLEWAMDNDMDVVNMSFGFGIQGVSVPTLVPPSQAADAAFTAAYEAGVVLVGASGNSSTPYVGYPAAHPAIIAVGATDDGDLIASFSQFGSEQELTAPGVNNYASYLVGLGIQPTLTVDTDGGREVGTIPLLYSGMTDKHGITTEAVYANAGTLADYALVDCEGRIAVVTRGGTSFAEKAQAAMDAGCLGVVIHNHSPGNFNGTLGAETTTDGRPWIPVVSTDLEEGLYLKEQIEAGETLVTLIVAQGNLAILSGTSMASPHVAGVAALVIGKNPALTPDEVRAILHSSAEDLGTPGWDPVFGHGLVNALRAVDITP